MDLKDSPAARAMAMSGHEPSPIAAGGRVRARRRSDGTMIRTIARVPRVQVAREGEARRRRRDGGDETGTRVGVARAARSTTPCSPRRRPRPVPLRCVPWKLIAVGSTGTQTSPTRRCGRRCWRWRLLTRRSAQPAAREPRRGRSCASRVGASRRADGSGSPRALNGRARRGAMQDNYCAVHDVPPSTLRTRILGTLLMATADHRSCDAEGARGGPLHHPRRGAQPRRRCATRRSAEAYLNGAPPRGRGALDGQGQPERHHSRRRCVISAANQVAIASS